MALSPEVNMRSVWANQDETILTNVHRKKNKYICKLCKSLYVSSTNPASLFQPNVFANISRYY